MRRLRLLAFLAFTILLGGVEAKAGVFLSSHSFATNNLPSIYTNESLPQPYRLRAKINGYYHATDLWNNNWTQLQSVPGAGTYFIEVYWVKYADDWSTIVEIGPFTGFTISISSPPQAPQTHWVGAPATSPGQSTTLTGRATDGNGNLQWLHFYTNDSNWSGYVHIGSSYAGSTGDATLSMNWQVSAGGPTGVYQAHLRAQDASGAWDWNGGASSPFAVFYTQPAVSSQNADGSVGVPFAPMYSGGGGTGAWQFVVSNRTNWGGGAPGTLLPPNNVVSSTWTPSEPGSYEFYVRKVGAGGYYDSNIAGPYFLTVQGVPPAIGIHPVAQTVTAGQTVSFAVTATGTAPLSYQWRKNGSNLAGATTEIYSLSNAQAGDSGAYSVVVINNAGSVASNAANLTVNLIAPAITAQPSSQVINAGQSATFSVTASGSTPLSYQWRKNGSNLAGATGASLSMTNAQTGDAGVYTVAVSNPVGSATSNSASLTVNTVPPSIITHPVSQNGYTGQSLSFSVAVTGTAPFAYQWRKNGVNIGGATNATHAIANAQPADAGAYSVSVANSVGSVVSNSATLTVSTVQPIRLALKYWQADDYPGVGVYGYQDVWVPAHDEDYGHWEDTDGDGAEDTWAIDGNHWVEDRWETQWVLITSYPNGQFPSTWATSAGTFDIGDAGSGFDPARTNRGHFLHPYALGDKITFHLFASAASGNASQFAFKLFSPSGSQIAGNAFNGSFAWSFDATQNGYYRVEISYLNANASPANGTVTYSIPVGVVPPPTITTQPGPATQTVGTGASVTYTVAAVGATSYQWTKDGVPIGGATSTTFTLANVQPAAAGSYAVIASNSVGSVASTAATLVVTQLAPTITSQPVGGSWPAGAVVTFSVVASGSAPMTYQWRRYGVALAGGSAASFSISSVQAGDAGDYSVVVSNALGTVTSAVAALAINASPPTIAQQPVSQSTNAGIPAIFSVSAAGSAPLAYQWRKDGAAIAGANSSSYLVANPQANNAGSYSVAVSNGVGAVISNPAALTVHAAQPIRLAVRYWQANDYPNRYSEGEYQDVNVAEYRTVYDYDDDGNSVGSHEVWFEGMETQWVQEHFPDGLHGSRWSTTVGTFHIDTADSGFRPDQIERGHFLNSYAVGNVITFLAHGAAPSGNCSSFEFKVFNPSGTQLAVYNFSSTVIWAITPYETGNYRLEVTFKNAVGTSPTAGTVRYYIPVGVATPPVIVTQPGPAVQAVNAGSAVQYSVTSTGAASFQWYKDNLVLPGATAATLTLANVQSADGGVYKVVLTNTRGSTTSNAVFLSITGSPPIITVQPTITAQPSSATVTVGQTATFTVTASGVGTPTYQWRNAGANIPGATSSTLTLTNAQTSAAGNYDVIVSSAGGSVTSTIAVLVVNAAGDDGLPQLRIHRPL